MADAGAELDGLLAGRPEAVVATTRAAIERLRALVPGAVETCEGGDYGIGTGPGDKGLVFVVTPLRDAVRIGIRGGASLDDPAGLLEGKGRVHRSLKVRTPADLDRDEVGELIARAAP
jgi:hypothetical protein